MLEAAKSSPNEPSVFSSLPLILKDLRSATSIIASISTAIEKR
jgi:hypothetical protein